MSKLQLSREFVKCLYNEKLKYEVSNVDNLSLSEFIEESLIDYFGITLIDINKEKVSVELEMSGLLTSMENVSGGNEYLTEDTKFENYVYVYMDPLKKLDTPIELNISGENFIFDFDPFYIGKGKGDRMFKHLNVGVDDPNFNKRNTIRNIIKNGHEPIIKIVKNELLAVEAYNLENILITKLPKLTNISGGKSKLEDYKINVDVSNTIEYNKVYNFLRVLNTSANNEEASKKLGISVRTLYRMKNQLGISKIDGVWKQSY